MCTNDDCIDYIRFRGLDWSQAKQWYSWIVRNEPKELPRICLTVGTDFLPITMEKTSENSEAL
jgi:hypothetical protein